MGLSILIPVFNFDVTLLVKALSDQLKQSGRIGEIVLIDDASDLSFDSINKTLLQIPIVKYSRNDVNAGRTATRKLLADKAQYDYLLFLDCDSKVINNDFLIKYIEQIDLNVQLATGGRVYNKHAPEKCSLRMHWKYGINRECFKNNRKSGPAFMSHNFLVKKSVFLNLQFSDQLKGYGHEDSFWGIQFRKMGVDLKQINNPVLHDNLEGANVFIDKAEQALHNLLELTKLIEENYLKKEIKIYRWYKSLKSIGFAAFISTIEKPFHGLLRANLISCRPSLLLFDLYRLAILIRIAGNK